MASTEEAKVNTAPAGKELSAKEDQPRETSCCSEVASTLKDEFKPSNFLFRKAHHGVLQKCLWVDDIEKQKWGVALFIAYRTVAAGYAFGVFLASVIINPFHEGSTGKMHFTLTYLTIWTYLVLCVYLIAAAVVSWLHYICCSSVEPGRGEKDVEMEVGEDGRTKVSVLAVPVALQFYWALHQVAAAGSLLVTILYFALLYSGQSIDFFNIAQHGINSVLILFDDFAGSATPVKLLHFIWSMMYGLAYILFTVFYQLADRSNNAVYGSVLDLNSPTSFGVTAVGAMVATIPLQIVLFLIYQLRVYIKRACCSSRAKSAN